MRFRQMANTAQNWNAHVKWTGPQIHAQLPEINLICAGMGTSGKLNSPLPPGLHLLTDSRYYDWSWYLLQRIQAFSIPIRVGIEFESKIDI